VPEYPFVASQKDFKERCSSANALQLIGLSIQRTNRAGKIEKKYPHERSAAISGRNAVAFARAGFSRGGSRLQSLIGHHD
jgi:hypothetical protein